MKETTFQLEIELIEPLLGSQPDKLIASEFLAKRAGMELIPDDEIETLPDVLEKGTTVFHRDEQDRVVLWDYQIKGFLKNSAKVQNGQVSGKIRNLKSKVNDQIFVSPRQIVVQMNGHGIEYLERPLRAETAQGPRVALARSEMIPAGARLKCGVTILGEVLNEDVLRELLDYGFWTGIGQWRNGGYGRFRYKLEREE